MITRYELQDGGVHDEDAFGKWVRYDDHLAEVERLKAIEHPTIEECHDCRWVTKLAELKRLCLDALDHGECHCFQDDTCPFIRLTAAIKSDVKECPKCGGSGQEYKALVDSGQMAEFMRNEKCWRCKGTGKIKENK